MVSSVLDIRKEIVVEPLFTLDTVDFNNREHIEYIWKYFKCATYTVDGVKSNSLYLPRLADLFRSANWWRRSYKNKIDLQTWLSSEGNQYSLKQNSQKAITEYVSEIYHTFELNPQYILRCEADLAWYIEFIASFFKHSVIREYCAYTEAQSQEVKFGVKYTGRLLARCDLYFPHKDVLIELKKSRSLIASQGYKQRSKYEKVFGKTCLLVCPENIHKFTELCLFRNADVTTLREIF